MLLQRNISEIRSNLIYIELLITSILHEIILKASRVVNNLSFRCYDKHYRWFPWFISANICHKDKLIIRCNNSLKSQHYWKNKPILIFTYQYTLISIYFLVPILQEINQKGVMIRSKCYGHDFIHWTPNYFLTLKAKNGLSILVYGEYISKWILAKRNGY